MSEVFTEVFIVVVVVVFFARINQLYAVLKLE